MFRRGAHPQAPLHGMCAVNFSRASPAGVSADKIVVQPNLLAFWRRAHIPTPQASRRNGFRPQNRLPG